MKKLVFATNNDHKLSEARSILGDKIEVLSLSNIDCHEDIAETGTTLEENAAIKAMYIHNHYQIDCFADDTGLEVEALNGLPGVHSARYANINGHDSQANINKLLANLKGIENRNAQFRTAVILIENGEKHLFEGIIKGKIITEQRGTAGFGYDSVFMPDGYNQTFAELGEDIKNKISHRALAMQKLSQYLLG